MLTITVQSKLVTDMLGELLVRTSDLSEPMKEIGAHFESRISERFETRSDPTGQAWLPWAESTRENYPEDGRGLLLEQYGEMLKSSSFSSDSSSVRVGFSAVASKEGDVYATYHEFGTEKMPRRGLLFDDPEEGTLAPADETAVLDIIGRFLQE